MARLLRTGPGDAARVSAIDEAVLDAVAEERSPTTLHVYRRAEPTVSLGRFCKVDEDLDRAYCEQEDIRVVRRLSAGGAIYTDPGHILFGLTGPDLPRGPNELLESAATALADEIGHRYGAEARFVPDNDVHADGRKVAGLAAAIRRNVVLLHGALVLDLDRQRMARALGRDPDEVDGRVAGLRDVVGREIPAEEGEELVIAALSGLVDEELVPRDLTETEEAAVRHLVSTRYEDDEWTYRR